MPAAQAAKVKTVKNGENHISKSYTDELLENKPLGCAINHRTGTNSAKPQCEIKMLIVMRQ